MLSAGCTGDNGSKGSSLVYGNSESQITTTLKASGLKGPVASVLEVITTGGEGLPDVKTYNYDEKGVLTSIVEECEVDMCTRIVNYSNGKPVDTIVIKDDDAPEDLSHTDTLFNADGKAAEVVYYDYQGNEVTRVTNEYDGNGNCVKSTSKSEWGTSVNEMQYDAEGRVVREEYSYNGKHSSTELCEYDKNGNVTRRESIFPNGSRNLQLASFDSKSNQTGSKMITVEDGIESIVYADTVYFTPDGLKHEDRLNFFEGYSLSKCTFNKEGRLLTFEEYPDGKGECPSKYECECLYGDEGELVKTIFRQRNASGSFDTTEKQYGKMDTFGNWTERSFGPTFCITIDGNGFGSPAEIISYCSTDYTRKITYRGEDQGDCYHYEGTYNGDPVTVTFCESEGIIRGEAELEGVTYDAAGTADRGFVQLYSFDRDRDGLITFEMNVRLDGEEATASCFSDGEWKEIDLSAAKDKPYRKFNVKPVTGSRVYGTYRYNHGENGAEGILDAFLVNWDDPDEGMTIAIECVDGAPSMHIANDRFDSYSEGRHSNYLMDGDRHFFYEVIFIDGYAIVRRIEGDPNGFFGLNTTVEGVYCKMDAAG